MNPVTMCFKEKSREFFVRKNVRRSLLVRLRVLRGDYPSLNVQRFGSKYESRVANPKDMLLFQRKRAVPQNRVSRRAGETVMDVYDIDENADAADNPSHVAHLVKRHMQQNGSKMKQQAPT